jgi:hypothetical protein
MYQEKKEETTPLINKDAPKSEKPIPPSTPPLIPSNEIKIETIEEFDITNNSEYFKEKEALLRRFQTKGQNLLDRLEKEKKQLQDGLDKDGQALIKKYEEKALIEKKEAERKRLFEENEAPKPEEQQKLLTDFKQKNQKFIENHLARPSFFDICRNRSVKTSEPDDKKERYLTFCTLFSSFLRYSNTDLGTTLIEHALLLDPTISKYWDPISKDNKAHYPGLTWILDKKNLIIGFPAEYPSIEWAWWRDNYNAGKHPISTRSLKSVTYCL